MENFVVDEFRKKLSEKKFWKSRARYILKWVADPYSKYEIVVFFFIYIIIHLYNFPKTCLESNASYTPPVSAKYITRDYYSYYFHFSLSIIKIVLYTSNAQRWTNCSNNAFNPYRQMFFFKFLLTLEARLAK